MNTYMHFKLTKSFYNLKRKFWINMWIDIMMGYKKAKHWKEPLFSISYHPSLFTIPNKNVPNLSSQNYFTPLIHSTLDSYYRLLTRYVLYWIFCALSFFLGIIYFWCVLIFFQVDHLLGGDYPVNASELSILKIILEWLESAQGASGKVH